MAEWWRRRWWRWRRPTPVPAGHPTDPAALGLPAPEPLSITAPPPTPSGADPDDLRSAWYAASRRRLGADRSGLVRPGRRAGHPGADPRRAPRTPPSPNWATPAGRRASTCGRRPPTSRPWPRSCRPSPPTGSTTRARPRPERLGRRLHRPGPPPGLRRRPDRPGHPRLSAGPSGRGPPRVQRPAPARGCTPTPWWWPDPPDPLPPPWPASPPASGRGAACGTGSPAASRPAISTGNGSSCSPRDDRLSRRTRGLAAGPDGDGRAPRHRAGRRSPRRTPSARWTAGRPCGETESGGAG